MKQTTRQSNTAHPRQSLFLRKMSCLRWDSNPRIYMYMKIFIYFSKPLRLLYSLIIYEIVNFSFFALYSLLLLSFFLYLKSVPIYVIVHVHIIHMPIVHIHVMHMQYVHEYAHCIVCSQGRQRLCAPFPWLWLICTTCTLHTET